MYIYYVHNIFTIIIIMYKYIMYMYICTCIYVVVCVYMCIYEYVYMCMHLYIHIINIKSCQYFGLCSPRSKRPLKKTPESLVSYPLLDKST